MMIKSFLPILALVAMTMAQDLRRYRKHQRYAIPEITAKQLEDDRDQLRQEVRLLGKRLLALLCLNCCSLIKHTGCSLLDASSSSFYRPLVFG